MTVAPVAYALTDLDDVKSWMDITDDDRDDDLQKLINAHSRWLMVETGREFKPWNATTDRNCRWDGGNWIDFGRFEAQTVTAIRLNPTGTSPTDIAVGDWQLEPVDAIDGVYEGAMIYGGGYAGGFGFGERRSGVVRVTGTWGWPEVPPDVLQALRRLVETSFRADVAFYADADVDVASDNAGGVQGGIPIDVWDVVRAHKRYTIGAA